MAIDEKHLENLSPEDSAVERLQKRNRRIRPWESSLLESSSKAPSYKSEKPSGQNTQGARHPLNRVPSGQKAQRAKHPLGFLQSCMPEGAQNPRGEKPSGSNTQRVNYPKGSFVREERQEPKRSTPGQNNPRVKYPVGESPRGPSTDSIDPHSSIDREGGFDPRPFLPEEKRSLVWCEKGHGELRIPHRLYEFLHRVTSTRNELLVLNCMVRFSLGFHREWCEAGYSFIASWTGISDITNVRKSIKSLVASGIIRKVREYNCASNAGSIYEIPVVKAYLNYLKASKGGNSESGPGPAEQNSENNGNIPGGDSPSGQNTQGTKQQGACGHNTHTPLGKTPTKKENANQNLNKTLSVKVPEQFASYVEQVKPVTKREMEIFYLNKLLEEFSTEDVATALQYVLRFGVLGRGEKAHSPLRYLATAAKDVIAVAKKSASSSAVEISKPKLEGEAKDGTENGGTKDADLCNKAIERFETDVCETERARYIAEFTHEQFPHGFLPPMEVITSLVASRWFRDQMAAIAQ